MATEANLAELIGQQTDLLKHGFVGISNVITKNQESAKEAIEGLKESFSDVGDNFSDKIDEMHEDVLKVLSKDHTESIALLTKMQDDTEKTTTILKQIEKNQKAALKSQLEMSSLLKKFVEKDAKRLLGKYYPKLQRASPTRNGHGPILMKALMDRDLSETQFAEFLNHVDRKAFTYSGGDYEDDNVYIMAQRHGRHVRILEEAMGERMCEMLSM
eukprot:TRINITY_DN6705_c0_g1_i3.p1 TRINITY_DN6705_c0_g1~~TRINITY_DN6705_c0_g1_i3.p1  ORF type:complete len:215 (-),score=64.42 TRINITY_DN6705_c0_g1_i3:192-836(-)